jgi:uncharacterized protein (DUF1800 family)
MSGTTTASAEPSTPEGLSRRAFLRTGAIAGIGAAVAVAPLADAIFAAPAGATGTFVSGDLDLHLLRRATFGLTPKTASKIKSVGRMTWLETQLAPDSIDDSFVDGLIADRLPRLSWSIKNAVDNLEGGSWDVMQDLALASVVRAAWSKRQLFEVMADFWSNHLNITNPSSDVWANRHDYDRSVIRAHALGKFSDMLAASATHPAMMLYLNNAESTKDAPNENYGRELLELHTLGVDGGYDELDMRNSALIMTGFQIDWNTYGFSYNKWDHYVGAVDVAGFHSGNASANGGYAVALSYVDYLAHHPSTATRIATKLVTHFVSDVPDPGLVAQLAQTYLANDTAIKPVLRQLFASPVFEASLGLKVRRPMEDVIATLRILGVQPDAAGTDGIQGLYWMIESLGNAPMAWSPPNGYPDTADAWRSAGGALGRWNTHMSLAAHWWPDAVQLPDLRSRFLPKVPGNYGAYVQTLAQQLTFKKFSSEHVAAVCTFLGKTPTDKLGRSDPAVKGRLPYVIALILDSPYFQIR